MLITPDGACFSRDIRPKSAVDNRRRRLVALLMSFCNESSPRPVRNSSEDRLPVRTIQKKRKTEKGKFKFDASLGLFGHWGERIEVGSRNKGAN